jgi:dinuclear metal center YbgI/SA1388 family protein
MATISDVLVALERIAPQRFAFPFDHVGLQVGLDHAKITRAVVTLDRSLGAIEFAHENEAQLLVAHHPLIFTPLESVTNRTHTGRSVLRLAELGIGFVAAHTNWDSAQGGVNDVLAKMFGLKNVRAFGSGALVNDVIEQPAGRIGELPEPMPFSVMVGQIDQLLQTTSYAWGKPAKKIRKVAVVGGAADGEWVAAQRAGADLLITGEVKQHVALEASESGLCIVAAGHYATEHPGALELKARLEAELPEITWLAFEPQPGLNGRPLE